MINKRRLAGSQRYSTRDLPVDRGRSLQIAVGFQPPFILLADHLGNPGTYTVYIQTRRLSKNREPLLPKVVGDSVVTALTIVEIDPPPPLQSTYISTNRNNGCVSWGPRATLHPLVNEGLPGGPYGSLYGAHTYVCTYTCMRVCAYVRSSQYALRRSPPLPPKFSPPQDCLGRPALVPPMSLLFSGRGRAAGCRAGYSQSPVNGSLGHCKSTACFFTYKPR